MQLQGYRVPLVTGTTEADLAGSLTYYFNAQQQVEQIAFHGTDGRRAKLLALLSNRYHFVRRLTNDPGLTVYESVRSDGSPAISCRFVPPRASRRMRPRQPVRGAVGVGAAGRIEFGSRLRKLLLRKHFPPPGGPRSH